MESPSIGSFNTFQARSQATSSIGISDRCTLSAGITLDGVERELLTPYTVVYGSRSERVIGEKANWEAEENLRIKHLGYLREIIPKYVPIFCPTGGTHADTPDSIECDRYEVIPISHPILIQKGAIISPIQPGSLSRHSKSLLLSPLRLAPTNYSPSYSLRDVAVSAR